MGDRGEDCVKRGALSLMESCNASGDLAGVAFQKVATSQNCGEGSETVMNDEASLILARSAYCLGLEKGMRL